MRGMTPCIVTHVANQNAIGAVIVMRALGNHNVARPSSDFGIDIRTKLQSNRPADCPNVSVV